MSTVEIRKVTKGFGGTPVVHDISLEIAEGEVLALLGPSGSGKTTLLRLIAGFETAESGQIFLAGRDVSSLGALDRRCGMVFQHYALFPHLTVAQNIGYGLAGSGLDKAAVDARVSEALELVDLRGLGTRPVTALSGGQQQRVALARAIAPRPAVLLLDEPLSNLDPSLRERTRIELRELLRRIGMTAVLVTHEQEEAFALADRIALLMHGRLEQVGTPQELYHQPRSANVVRFIGRASAVPGTVTGREDDGSYRVDALSTAFVASGDPGDATHATLFIRPEALGPDDLAGPTGTVLSMRFIGHLDYVIFDIDGHQVEVAMPAGAVTVGERVQLAQMGAGVHVFRTEKS